MRAFVFNFKTLVVLFLLAVCGLAQANGVAYASDSLGRIIRVDYANGAIVQYTYDAVGNRTSRTLTPQNKPPVANAGPDTTVNIARTATLNGSASFDPDKVPSPLTYAWTQASGTAVTLTNPVTATPYFRTPKAGDYVFNLVVYDGKDYSTPSKITVHSPANKIPVTNAGTDQTVINGAQVTLDGSASSEPDKGPSPLTYAWTQISGPATVYLSGATSAKLTFTASKLGDYLFGLLVNDGKDNSTQTKVTIHVHN